jgi:hypothetical protein
MEALLALIITWLSHNFDLPAAQEHPAIELVSDQHMATLRYGAAAVQGPQLIALYDDRTKTILLSDRWTASTPAEVSVLVHELVHHLQNLAKLDYPCPAAREAVAYAAQDKWLGLFGRNLLTEFEIDAMTLKIRTACM